jgi:hypothetical protein
MEIIKLTESDFFNAIKGELYDANNSEIYYEKSSEEDYWDREKGIKGMKSIIVRCSDKKHFSCRYLDSRDGFYPTYKTNGEEDFYFYEIEKVEKVKPKPSIPKKSWDDIFNECSESELRNFLKENYKTPNKK